MGKDIVDYYRHFNNVVEIVERNYGDIAPVKIAEKDKKYSKNKDKAAYMAMWWASLKNSSEIVADRVNTFHDPWHKGHMTSDLVKTAYTPAGIKAIETSLKVASPPIYLTGYLEFQDQLAKNLSEAYVGQKKPDAVLKDTEAAWTKIVRRIGKRKLKQELESYKAVFPKVDVPT